MNQSRKRRQGNIVVLTVFMMVLLIAIAAFAIEMGQLVLAKSELQRSADSAALAACGEYFTQKQDGASLDDAFSAARNSANEFAGLNVVRLNSPNVDLNSSNDSGGQIVIGKYDFANPSAGFVPDDTSSANAVKVTVYRNSSNNGELPFRFGRLLGIDSTASQADAIAVKIDRISGFRTPDNDKTLNVLPFALKEDTWNDMLAGVGPDTYHYDESTGQITNGADGKLEINLYPQATGSSGNSGTVDIGHAGNSTADLVRQIKFGINADDLSYVGGELKLGPNGTLVLNGDTGISAGMKSALETVVGKPRIIMIYRSVTGNGNNANFTIVKFVGIRILEVDFKGSKKTNKKIMIQIANVDTDYVIVPTDPAIDPSDNVFSYVTLVH